MPFFGKKRGRRQSIGRKHREAPPTAGEQNRHDAATSGEQHDMSLALSYLDQLDEQHLLESGIWSYGADSGETEPSGSPPEE